MTASRHAITALVRRIIEIPYAWPGEPDAGTVRRTGRGTCASKHALLRDELDQLGLTSRSMFAVGRLVPDVLRGDPALMAAAHLCEVHEFVTVSLPDIGPCRVDVTWDPPLVRAGLPGQATWDGRGDMRLAIGATTETWAPDPARLRTEKEQLRRRLYTARDRELRDATLATMSDIFQRWRDQ